MDEQLSSAPASSPLASLDKTRTDIFNPFVDGDPVLRGYRPYDPSAAALNDITSGANPYRTYLGEPVAAVNVAGKTMTRAQLQTIDGGRDLLYYTDQLASGKSRGFTESVKEAFSSPYRYLPFVSQLATVGGSIRSAVRASKTLEQLMENGNDIDSVSDEDRVALQTYMLQGQWEGSTTMGGRFADIVTSMPAFAAEMGATSALAKAGTAGVAKLAPGFAARHLSISGATKSAARGMASTARDAILAANGINAGSFGQKAVDQAVQQAAVKTLRGLVGGVDDTLASALSSTSKQASKALADLVTTKGNKQVLSEAGAALVKKLSAQSARDAHVMGAVSKVMDNPKLMSDVAKAVVAKNTDEGVKLLKPFADKAASTAGIFDDDLLVKFSKLVKAGDVRGAMDAANAMIQKGTSASAVDDIAERAIRSYSDDYVNLMLNLKNEGIVKQTYLHTMGFLKDHALRGVFEHYDMMSMLPTTVRGELRNALGLAIEAPLKGLLYSTMGTVARVPMSLLLTGGERALPLHTGELHAQARAFMSGDENLMNNAFWVGFGQLAVEMASENIGEAFSMLGRGAINANWFGKGSLASRLNAFVNKGSLTNDYLKLDKEGAMSFRRWLSAFCGDTSSNALQAELFRKQAIQRLLRDKPYAMKVFGRELSLDDVLADPALKTRALQESKRYMGHKALSIMFATDMMQRAANNSWKPINLLSPTSIRKTLKLTGWDGTLEEWLEERYGGFVSHILGLDPESEADKNVSGIAALVRATLPSTDDGIAELLAFMIPGVMANSLSRAQAALGGGALTRFNEIMERGERMTNHSMGVLDGFASKEELAKIKARAARATRNAPDAQGTGDDALDGLAGDCNSMLFEGDQTLGAVIQHTNEDFAGTNIQAPQSKEEVDQFIEDMIDASIQYTNVLDDTAWNTTPSVMTRFLHKALGMITAVATGNFAALRWNPLQSMTQTWSSGRSVLLATSQAVREAREQAEAQASNMVTEELEKTARWIQNRYARSMQGRAAAGEEAGRKAAATREQVKEYLERSLIESKVREILAQKFALDGALRLSMDGSIAATARRLAGARIQSALDEGKKELSYMDPSGRMVTVQVPAKEDTAAVEALREKMVEADRINLGVRFLSLASTGALSYNVEGSQRNQRIASLYFAADRATRDPDSNIALYQSQLDAALAATEEFKNVDTFMKTESLDDPLGQRLQDFGAVFNMDDVAEAAKLDPEKLDTMTDAQLSKSSEYAALVAVANGMRLVHAGNSNALSSGLKQILRMCKMLSLRYGLDNAERQGPRVNWYKQEGTSVETPTFGRIIKADNEAPVRTVAYRDENDQMVQATFAQTENGWYRVGEDLSITEDKLEDLLATAGYEPVRTRFVFAPCSTVVVDDPIVAVARAATARSDLFGLLSGEVKTPTGKTYDPLSTFSVERIPGAKPAKVPGTKSFYIFRDQASLEAVRSLVKAYEKDQTKETYKFAEDIDPSIDTLERGAEIPRHVVEAIAADFYNLEEAARTIATRSFDVSNAYGNPSGSYVIRVGALSDARTVVVPFDPAFQGSPLSAVVHSLVYNRLKNYNDGLGNRIDSDSVAQRFSLHAITESFLSAVDQRIGEVENQIANCIQAQMASTQEHIGSGQKSLRELELDLTKLQQLRARVQSGPTPKVLADMITNITFGYGHLAATKGNYLGYEAVWGDVAQSWFTMKSRPGQRESFAGASVNTYKHMLDLLAAELFYQSPTGKAIDTAQEAAACMASFVAPGSVFDTLAADGTLAWFKTSTAGTRSAPSVSPSMANVRETPPEEKPDLTGIVPPTPTQKVDSPSVIIQETEEEVVEKEVVVGEPHDLTPAELAVILQNSAAVLPKDASAADVYAALAKQSAVKAGSIEQEDTDDTDDTDDEDDLLDPQDENDTPQVVAPPKPRELTDKTLFSELPLESKFAIYQVITAINNTVFSTDSTVSGQPQNDAALDASVVLKNIRKALPHIGVMLDDQGRDTRALAAIHNAITSVTTKAASIKDAAAALKEVTTTASGVDEIERLLRSVLKRNVTMQAAVTTEEGADAAFRDMFADAFVDEDEESDTDEENNAKDGGFELTAMQALNGAAEWQTIKFLLTAAFPVTRGNTAQAARQLAKMLSTDGVARPAAEVALHDLILSGHKFTKSPLFVKGNQTTAEAFKDLQPRNLVARTLIEALRLLPRHRSNKMVAALANVVEVEAVKTGGRDSSTTVEDRGTRLSKATEQLYRTVAQELLTADQNGELNWGVLANENKANWSGTLKGTLLSLFGKDTTCPTLRRALAAYDIPANKPYYDDVIGGSAGMFDANSIGSATLKESVLVDPLKAVQAAIGKVRNGNPNDLSPIVEVLVTSGAARFNPNTADNLTTQGNLTKLLNAYLMSHRAGRRTLKGSTTELNKAAISVSQQYFVKKIREDLGLDKDKVAERFCEWEEGQPIFTHVVSKETSGEDIYVGGVVALKNALVANAGNTWIQFQTYTGDRSTLSTVRMQVKHIKALYKNLTGSDPTTGSTVSLAAAAKVYLDVAKELLRMQGVDQIEAKRTQIVGAEQIPIDLTYYDAVGKAHAPRMVCVLAGGGANESLFGSGQIISPKGHSECPLKAFEPDGANTSKVHLVGGDSAMWEMTKGNFLIPDANGGSPYTQELLTGLFNFGKGLATTLGTRVVLTDFDGIKVGALALKKYTLTLKPAPAEDAEGDKKSEDVVLSDARRKEIEKILEKGGKSNAVISSLVYLLTSEITTEEGGSEPGMSLDKVEKVLSTQLSLEFNGKTKTLGEFMPGLRIHETKGTEEAKGLDGSGYTYALSYESANLQALQAANLYHESKPEQGKGIAKNLILDLQTRFAIEARRGGEASNSCALTVDALVGYSEIAALLATSGMNKDAFLAGDEELERNYRLGNGSYASEMEYELALNAHAIKMARPAGPRTKAILVSPGAKYKGAEIVDGEPVEATLFDAYWFGDDPFYNATETKTSVGRLRANINDPRVRYGCFVDKGKALAYVNKTRKEGEAEVTEAKLGRFYIRGLLLALAGLDGITATTTSKDAEKQKEIDADKEKKAALLGCFVDCYGQPMTLETHGRILWGDSVGSDHGKGTDQTVVNLEKGDNASGSPLPPTHFVGGEKINLGAYKFYVGGTLVPFPRTPSGNAGPVFTALRLSTPVTFRKVTDKNGATHYAPGTDSLATPPPDAEWRQGSDNDGDTAMINLPFVNGKVIYGMDDITKYATRLRKALSALREAVSSYSVDRETLLANNKKYLETTANGEVVLAKRYRDLAGALFAASFNAASLARNADNDGLKAYYGVDWGVGTLPKEYAAGELHRADAITAPRGDEMNPQNDLADPRLVAFVTTSGRAASQGRGSIVAGMSSMHTAQLYGFAPAIGHERSVKLIEVDGLFTSIAQQIDGASNSLFDDLKEQIAWLLRLNPQTVDAFLGLVITGIHGKGKDVTATDAKAIMTGAFETVLTASDGAYRAKEDGTVLNPRKAFTGDFGRAFAFAMGVLTNRKSQDHYDLYEKKIYSHLAGDFFSATTQKPFVKLASNKRLISTIAKTTDDKKAIEAAAGKLGVNATRLRDVKALLELAAGRHSLLDIGKSSLIRGMVADLLLSDAKAFDAKKEAFKKFVTAVGVIGSVHRFAANANVAKASARQARVVTAVEQGLAVSDVHVYFSSSVPMRPDGAGSVEEDYSKAVGVIVKGERLKGTLDKALAGTGAVSGNGVSELRVTSALTSLSSQDVDLILEATPGAPSKASPAAETTADEEETVQAAPEDEIDTWQVNDIMNMVPAAYAAHSWARRRAVAYGWERGVHAPFMALANSAVKDAGDDTLKFLLGVEGAVFGWSVVAKKMADDLRVKIARDKKKNKKTTEESKEESTEEKVLGLMDKFYKILTCFDSPQTQGTSGSRLRLQPSLTDISPQQMALYHSIVGELLDAKNVELLSEFLRSRLTQQPPSFDDLLDGAQESTDYNPLEDYKTRAYQVCPIISGKYTAPTPAERKAVLEEGGSPFAHPAQVLVALVEYSTIVSRSKPTADAGSATLLDFFPVQVRQEVFGEAGKITQEFVGWLTMASTGLNSGDIVPEELAEEVMGEEGPTFGAMLYPFVKGLGSRRQGNKKYGGTEYAPLIGVNWTATNAPVNPPEGPTTKKKGPEKKGPENQPPKTKTTVAKPVDLKQVLPRFPFGSKACPIDTTQYHNRVDLDDPSIYLFGRVKATADKDESVNNQVKQLGLGEARVILQLTPKESTPGEYGHQFYIEVTFSNEAARNGAIAALRKNESADQLELFGIDVLAPKVEKGKPITATFVVEPRESATKSLNAAVNLYNKQVVPAIVQSYQDAVAKAQEEANKVTTKTISEVKVVNKITKASVSAALANHEKNPVTQWSDLTSTVIGVRQPARRGMPDPNDLVITESFVKRFSANKNFVALYKAFGGAEAAEDTLAQYTHMIRLPRSAATDKLVDVMVKAGVTYQGEPLPESPESAIFVITEGPSHYICLFQDSLQMMGRGDVLTGSEVILDHVINTVCRLVPPESKTPQSPVVPPKQGAGNDVTPLSLAPLQAREDDAFVKARDVLTNAVVSADRTLANLVAVVGERENGAFNWPVEGMLDGTGNLVNDLRKFDPLNNQALVDAKVNVQDPGGIAGVLEQIEQEICSVMADTWGVVITPSSSQELYNLVKALARTVWKTRLARQSSWTRDYSDPTGAGDISKWPSLTTTKFLVSHALAGGTQLIFDNLSAQLRNFDAWVAKVKDAASKHADANGQFNISRWKDDAGEKTWVEHHAALWVYADMLHRLVHEFFDSNPFSSEEGKNADSTAITTSDLGFLVNLLSNLETAAPIPGVITPGFEYTLDDADRRDAARREYSSMVVSPGSSVKDRVATIMGERYRGNPTAAAYEKLHEFNTRVKGRTVDMSRYNPLSGFAEYRANNLAASIRKLGVFSGDPAVGGSFAKNLVNALLLRTTPFIDLPNDAGKSSAALSSMLRILDGIHNNALREGGSPASDLLGLVDQAKDILYDAMALVGSLRVLMGDHAASRFMQDGFTAVANRNTLANNGWPKDTPQAKLAELNLKMLAPTLTEADENGTATGKIKNPLPNFLAQVAQENDPDMLSPLLIEMDPQRAFASWTLPREGHYNLRESMMYSSGAEVVVEAMDMQRFVDCLFGVSDPYGRIPEMAESTDYRIVQDKGIFRRSKEKDFKKIKFTTPEQYVGRFKGARFTDEETAMVKMYLRLVTSYAFGGTDNVLTGVGNASIAGFPLEIGHLCLADKAEDTVTKWRILSREEFLRRYSKEELTRRHMLAQRGESSTDSLSVWLTGLYRDVPSAVLDGLGFADKILNIIYDAGAARLREVEETAGRAAKQGDTSYTRHVVRSNLQLSRAITRSVKQALTDAGLLETSDKKDGRGREITTLVVPGKDITDAFFGSSAYTKLVTLAGRPREMLTKEYVKNLVAPVIQKLSRFRNLNPEIFNGELGKLCGSGSDFWLADGMGMFSQSDTHLSDVLNGKRMNDVDEAAANTIVSYARTLSLRGNHSLFVSEQDPDTGEIYYKVAPWGSGVGIKNIFNEIVLSNLKMSGATSKDFFSADNKFTAEDILRMGFIDEQPPEDQNRADWLHQQIRYNVTIGKLAKMVYQKMMARITGGAELTKEEKRYRRVFEMSTAPYDLPGPTQLGGNMIEAFRRYGVLPKDAGPGSMLKAMAMAVSRACAFAGTLHNVITTLSTYGMPNYVLCPSDDPVPGEVIPDQMWGELAQWYAKLFPSLGIVYNSSISGRANCRAAYEKIDASGVFTRQYIKMTDDVESGEGSGSIAGVGHIRCFHPGKEYEAGKIKKDDANNFLAKGGEAYCYLKTLCGLRQWNVDSGSWWKAVDTINSFAKSMNVFGSFFFAIATGFESPIAATGLMQTVLGKLPGDKANEWMHELAEKNPGFADLLNNSAGAAANLAGGGNTRDLGFEGGYSALSIRDVWNAWQSNDPGLSQLKRLCTSCGITMSYPGENNFFDSNAKNWEANVDKAAAHFGKLVSKATDITEEAARKFIGGFLRGVAKDSQERSFVHLMNVTKLAVASQLLSRLRSQAIMEGRYFNPIKELRKVGNYINEEVGGINPLAHAFVTPEFKRLHDRIWFSWQWTMGSWAAGAMTVLSNGLFGGEATNPALRGFFWGRWARMYGWVQFGMPVFFQLCTVAFGRAVLGLLGDDDDKKKYRPDLYNWWNWNNERRGRDSWDYTPLLDAFAVIDDAATGGFFQRAKQGAYGSTAKFLTTVVPMTSDLTNPRERRKYGHLGKQGAEIGRWWTDPIGQGVSKLSIPLQNFTTQLFGANPVSGFEADWKKEKLVGAEKLWSQVLGVAQSFAPFTFGGLANFPEAGILTTVGPVKMGTGSWMSQTELTQALLNYARSAPMTRGRSKKFQRLRANLNEILADAVRNGQDPDQLLTTSRAQAIKTLYEEVHRTRPLSNAKPSGDYLRAVSALRALGVQFKQAEKSLQGRLRRGGKTVDLKGDPAYEVARKALKESLGPSLSLYEDPGLLRQDVKGGDAFDQKGLPTTIFGIPVEGEGVRIEGKAPKTVLGVKIGGDPEDPEDPKDPKGPGPKARKTLASDALPLSVFGIQVVTEPHEYFDQDPRVPGFYEMGDEGPMGQADEKGGYIADDYSQDEVESRWVGEEYHEVIDEKAEVEEDNWNNDVDMTHMFNTPIPTGREAEYEEWRKVNQGNDPGYNYDYVGAFLAGYGKDSYANGHLPDTYKKPNHPTYDPRGSQYQINAGQAARLGINRRQWVDRSKFIYRDGDPGSPDRMLPRQQ